MKTSPFSAYHEHRRPAIIFLAISLALFLAFSGFFVWHTVTLRNYELHYVKSDGTVVGAVRRSSTTDRGGSRSYYYLVIAYTFDGQDYQFTDRTGQRYFTNDLVGTTTAIYVNPQQPQQAEKVTSADYISLICACFFAFFCVTYATGMNLWLSTKRTSFTKRLLAVWGAEILLGVTLVLLFWLSLPHSSFGAVFTRIQGAVGITVVTGVVLLVALLDGIITHWLRAKLR